VLKTLAELPIQAFLILKKDVWNASCVGLMELYNIHTTEIWNTETHTECFLNKAAVRKNITFEG